MRQTLEEFLRSKVNWTGMLAGAMFTYLFLNQHMSWQEYSQSMSPVLLAMGLRDTLFK